MAEFRLSPKAQRDLDGVFDHTVTHWDLSQAMHYTDLVESACTGLAEASLQSQNCATIRQGYRRRNIEQHVVYFRQTSYGIMIVRILHQCMDAPRRL